MALRTFFGVWQKQSHNLKSKSSFSVGKLDYDLKGKEKLLSKVWKSGIFISTSNQD